MDTEEYYGGTYPSPNEIEEKEIKAHIVMEFDLKFSVPITWDKDKIIDDIKENLKYYDKYNEEIVDMEV